MLIVMHLNKHRDDALLKRGAAVIFDIDDTLVGEEDTIADGFDSMVKAFLHARRSGFDVYIVTARPESSRKAVLELFNDTLPSKMPESFRGFGKRGEPNVLDTSNLKMLPDEDYWNEEATRLFKLSSYYKICKNHGGRCSTSAGIESGTWRGARKTRGPIPTSASQVVTYG